MPSPGGKGDREAVDEEWRHLAIHNAVHSNGTTFPNVPFSRNAYKYGTYRRSSSAPVCALGHLPPGGRHCAAVIPTFSNIPEGDTTSYISYLISDISLAGSGPSGNGQSVISHNPPVLLDRTGATIASKTNQFRSSVIANQSADWCGNLTPRGFYRSSGYRIVSHKQANSVLTATQRCNILNLTTN